MAKVTFLRATRNIHTQDRASSQHYNKQVLNAFLLAITFLVVPGLAQATAIMNVYSDWLDLEVQMDWGHNEHDPALKPIGSLEIDSFSGSLLSNTSNLPWVSVASNMGWAGAGVQYFNSDSDRTTIMLDALLDDDRIGSYGTGDRFARLGWNLFFGIQGEGALLDIGGNEANSSSCCTSYVQLFDLTAGTFNTYIHGFGIELLDDHTYFLSAFNEQSRFGIDQAITTHMRFDSVILNVPEPSTLILLGAGLTGLCFSRKIKKGKYVK